jgi:hypothetical protein
MLALATAGTSRHHMQIPSALTHCAGWASIFGISRAESASRDPLAMKGDPMAKKESKKAKPKAKPSSEPRKSKELSEDELEHVAGGAYDAFLKIEGVQGESLGQKSPLLVTSANAFKIEYKP